MRKPYPSDLTDEQWAILEPLIPPADPGGRPRTVDMREVLNTLLYLNRSGCQWDMLPHDLLPRSTVFGYFARWRDDGTWQAILDALRARVRQAAGREPTPRVALIDSQSVKTTELGGERGYDGGKKVTGRKRHILTDTMGLLLVVLVTTAKADDGTTAPKVLDRLERAAYPRLEVVRGDAKYKNDGLAGYLEHNAPGYRFEVVRRPEGARGFVLEPKRWPIERTHAWIGRCRRHAKDVEWWPESSESMIQVSMIHLMLRRLKPDPSRRPIEPQVSRFTISRPVLQSYAWGDHTNSPPNNSKNADSSRAAGSAPAVSLKPRSLADWASAGWPSANGPSGCETAPTGSQR